MHCPEVKRTSALRVGINAALPMTPMLELPERVPSQMPRPYWLTIYGDSFIPDPNGGCAGLSIGLFDSHLSLLRSDDFNRCHEAISNDGHPEEHVYQGHKIDNDPGNLVSKGRVLRVPDWQDDTLLAVRRPCTGLIVLPCAGHIPWAASLCPKTIQEEHKGNQPKMEEGRGERLQP